MRGKHQGGNRKRDAENAEKRFHKRTPCVPPAPPATQYQRRFNAAPPTPAAPPRRANPAADPGHALRPPALGAGTGTRLSARITRHSRNRPGLAPGRQVRARVKAVAVPV
ncbi:MAG: TOBE domain-containing protein [Opitutaceae bacterium]|nr:TOBE domain-containing protein [Opitutaceae bacterium]